jgi:hypothetical protein
VITTAISGKPGESWTNHGQKVQFQLSVKFANSCAACIQYANQIGKHWPLPFHRGCNCTQVPIAPGQSAEPFLDFMKEIGKLPPHQQAVAIGRSNWALITSGKAAFSDVVTPTRVRDFREVVDRKRLKLPDLLAAGVSKARASKALGSVDSSDRETRLAKGREAYQTLLRMGLKPEQIRAGLAGSLAARVGISGPSGAEGIVAPPTPTPAGPKTTRAKPRKVPKPQPRSIPVPVAAASEPLAEFPAIPPSGPGEIIPPRPSPRPVPIPVATPAASRRWKGKRDYEPEGEQVGHAFRLADPKRGDEIREGVNRAIAAIEGVHGVGATKLPKLLVISEWDPDIKGGYYSDGRVALQIGVTSSKGPDSPQALIFAHETGHFLDHVAIPGRPDDKARERGVTPEMDAVLDAARASRATSTIASRRAVGYVTVPTPDGGSVDYDVSRKYINYLLDDAEIWARAYAQYIAIRSGDSVMKAQLDRERDRSVANVVFPRHWEDDDFAPIAARIDALFLKLGWIK